MNKKLATVLAATCVLGATTAFAANPFSDVQPSDWAYQAVEQLADEGIIIGYPDGTFGGERNITRYEMAQMVARAMAHEDMANAEQQAQINRLANEFANELNSLGVRVTNLENRLGNVKIGGEARVGYFKDDYKLKLNGDKVEAADGNVAARLQLGFDAKVADNTSVFAELETNIGLDKSVDGDGSIEVTHLYVNHDFGGFALQGGRYDVTLGATGFFYDEAFDGVTATFGDKFQLEAGYGKMKGVLPYVDVDVNKLGNSLKDLTEDDTLGGVLDGVFEAGKAPEAWYVQVGTSVTDDITVKAFYLDLEKVLVDGEKYDANFWGAGLNAQLGDALQIRGDYVQNTEKYGEFADKPQFWTAGLLFGAADSEKVGSFEIGADYISAERLSYLNGSGLDITAPLVGSLLGKVTYWQASAAVVPVENTLLKAYYAFDVKAKGEGLKGTSDNLWGVEFNYYF